MGITNQKSTIDTQTKEKQQSKYNTKDRHHITREQKRKRRKKTFKKNSKELTKWQLEHSYQ